MWTCPVCGREHPWERQRLETFIGSRVSYLRSGCNGPHEFPLCTVGVAKDIVIH